MLIIRPCQPAMNRAVRMRMKPAQAMMSTFIARRWESSAASKASRLAIGLVVDELCGDAIGSGELQSRRIGAVGDDAGDFGRIGRIARRLDQRHHVGAAA